MREATDADFHPPAVIIRAHEIGMTQSRPSGALGRVDDTHGVHEVDVDGPLPLLLALAGAERADVRDDDVDAASRRVVGEAGRVAASVGLDDLDDNSDLLDAHHDHDHAGL